MVFLNTLYDFFSRHYTWIFSGVGVPFVLFLLTIFFRRSSSAGKVIKKQSSKGNSANYMSGRDITINNGLSVADASKLFPVLPQHVGVLDVVPMTRHGVKNLLKPYFAENKVIFDTYGPTTDERFNPESSMPELWQRKVQEFILPNNEKIVELLQDSQHLLLDWERDVFARYKQHVNDFSAKHTGKTTVTGIPFPMKILTILE